MTVEAKKNVKGTKGIKFSGLKTSPSKPTEDQLAKINQFTREPFTADQMYVGQLRLANNAIDRDNERFSEEILQRFAATAIRKTMLFDHARQSQDSAVGKFFDVSIEKLPLQQANAETGENFQLPDGVTEVQFLTPWFYIPRSGVDEKVIVKIDAGIYDFASIGFRAENLVPIRSTEKGKEDVILFWEYRGSGQTSEMTEGSLVYLGAQQGMGVKTADKGEGNDDNKQDKNPDNNKQKDAEAPAAPAKSNQGGITMTIQELLERLKIFFGRTFSEASLYDEIKAAVEERINLAVEGAKKPLNEEINKLKPLAEDGKSYRNNLVSEYVGLKVKLNEVSEKPELQTALKEVAAGYPIDFLKAEIALLKTRVFEKFPAESQLSGGDIDRTNGKTKVNPLVPKE